MKKILSLILVCTMMLSLAACGQKEDTKVPAENNTTIEETQKPVENVEEKEEVSTGTTNTETEKEEVNMEDSKETEPSEAVKEPEQTEESEVNPEGNTEEKTTETTRGVITLAEESDLQTAAEFSGLYKLNGYSRMEFFGTLEFQAGMEGVNVENSGEVDLSEAKLPDNILNYVDYTYFSLTFENDEIVDWDVVDRTTNESILNLSDDELANCYFPEVNFEIVDAGELPETINLSNYEVGKTYAFAVSSEENFSTPSIVNDTEIPLLIVSIKNGIDEDFEREYKPKYFAPDNSSGSTYSEDGKYYVAIIEGDSAELMGSDECLLLDGYAVGDELDFDFQDFVGNNTDKTITILVDDWGVETEIILAPGDVAYCSWMNDVSIKSIS